MNITVDTERVNISLDKLSAEAQERVLQAMKQAGVIVEGDAKQLCPTGNYTEGGGLRESIHTKTEHDKNSIITTVFTNQKYAAYVEFGTGPKGDPKVPHTTKTQWVCKIPQFAGTYGTKDEGWRTIKGMKPRPFMYPALKNNKKLIRSLIESAVGGV